MIKFPFNPHHWLSLLVCLLQLCHMYHPFLPSPQWTLPILVPLFSTLITLNLYYHYSSYHLLLYSTLHYSVFQHFKLILGYCYLFYYLLLLPAISDQVSELFATETQLSSSFFKFFSQFGEGAFFFEQVAY